MQPEISTNQKTSSPRMTVLPDVPSEVTSELSKLEQAIFQTVAYVDMYEYPLTAEEIHRYLIAVRTTQPEVEGALENGHLLNHHLEKLGEYFFLTGRGQIVETRRRRAQASEQLWPLAVHYGRIVSAIPFVSMVAVTGSLAVDNIDSSADIDYLIVTSAGRLWLCRAMIILLVRQAARRGIYLCPNYFLSEQALRFDERNLYTAHEIAQMVPIAGMETYNQLRELNQWVTEILPNSDTSPRQNFTLAKALAPVRSVRRLGEIALRTPPGGWLEQWEMNRKVRRFSQKASSETAFSADCCKGHFETHGQQTLDEFANQWQKLVTPTLEEQSE